MEATEIRDVSYLGEWNGVTITRRRRGQSQQSPPVPEGLLNIQRSDIQKDTCAEKEGCHRASHIGHCARARGQWAIDPANNPIE